LVDTGKPASNKEAEFLDRPCWARDIDWFDETKNTQNEMHYGLAQEGSYSA
jgi:hypothetical protein